MIKLGMPEIPPAPEWCLYLEDLLTSAMALAAWVARRQTDQELAGLCSKMKLRYAGELKRLRQNVRIAQEREENDAISRE